MFVANLTSSFEKSDGLLSSGKTLGLIKLSPGVLHDVRFEIDSADRGRPHILQFIARFYISELIFEEW